MDGLEYQPRCVLVFDLNQDDPVFGLVDDIFIISSEVFFKISVLSMIKMAYHYHAYLVEQVVPLRYVLINQESH